jgi:hypothetical protein
MPETEPLAPPAKPQVEPAPETEPRRELEPFDPDWPSTRPTPEPQSIGCAMNDAENDAEVRQEIHKRLTLNWLIQGVSQHAGMTAHYLVRDELEAIHPRLLRLYDQFALIILLQHWRLDAVMLLGRPGRFWQRAASQPSHPFYGHTLLSRHGGMLAAAAKQRGLERAKEKGLTRFPILFTFQAVYVICRLAALEAAHARDLVELAKKATARVWGIATDRLNAELTTKVAFGSLSKPQSLRGRILRRCAVAYGGVLRREGALEVVARGSNWCLVTKELVKGTAELICLHGLNRLSDDVYEQVMRHADRIEFEPWMLQTGGELWRRLLAVLPEGRAPAEMVMHLARLPPRSLESLMLAVIEQPDWARELLAGLGTSDAEPNAAADRGR